MKKLIKDLIKARQYTERRKEKRKMKKLHAFEGWFDEATEGFAGAEMDLHGFKTVDEYIEAYFDGVECYITTKEAERLAALYEDYRQSVLDDGQYSLAYDRMIEAVEDNE